jgi:glycosyltransferase involved in cell wall biosynthesis
MELARGAGHFAGVPVRHVPYGVTMVARAESTADRGACRAELGLARDARVVLLVAADFRNPFKGMRLAKETLARLGTPVTVLVLGSNGDEIEAAAPVEVRRLGFVSDEGTLARAYRAADVTLVPSIADNLPYVSLESLSCGTPVAAFEVGGLVDVVGTGEERGVLARRFDTAELAAKVRGILENPSEGEARGAAGRRWVLENCDMESWVDRHLDLYAEAGARARADVGPGVGTVCGARAKVTEGGA